MKLSVPVRAKYAAVVLLLMFGCTRQLADAIACSPYVYPCQCGLCPHIVNCSIYPSAECYCGTAQPGSYPHPKDKTKFWMCSYDRSAQIRYGVEVQCPGRLMYDPVVKVCTLPNALTANSTSSKRTVSPNNAASSKPATPAVAQERAAAAKKP